MQISTSKGHSCGVDSDDLGKDPDFQKLLNVILERKLAAPALVMLELYRPMVGMADALIIFAQPFLKAFSIHMSVLKVLRDRAAVDYLILELERSEIKISNN